MTTPEIPIQSVRVDLGYPYKAADVADWVRNFFQHAERVQVDPPTAFKVRYVRAAGQIEVIKNAGLPDTSRYWLSIHNLEDPRFLELPAHLVDESYRRPGVWIDSEKVLR